MIRFRNVVLLACLYISGYSQGVDLPKGSGFFIEEESKERLEKKYNLINEYSLTDLSKTGKWTYFLTLSSIRLYSGRDSSVHYFYKAFDIRPKSTCRVMRLIHYDTIGEIQDGHKEKTYSWYLWDLPNFDEFSFIDFCNQKYPRKKRESIVKDSTHNSEIIRRRDQKYRSMGKLKEQQELDQLNRKFIDSLFLLNGSLKSFTGEEIYQFSMVAHHSEDCEWNYKWMERLIDHNMSGYNGKMLLGPLLERMLDAKDGYCTEQDAQKRNYFIYMIKDKYPEFVEQSQLSW